MNQMYGVEHNNILHIPPDKSYQVPYTNITKLLKVKVKICVMILTISILPEI